MAEGVSLPSQPDVETRPCPLYSCKNNGKMQIDWSRAVRTTLPAEITLDGRVNQLAFRAVCDKCGAFLWYFRSVKVK